MVAFDVTPAVMNAATPEAAAILYRKMAVVMGTVTRLAKTGKNPHFGYTFATAQDVADAIRSALAEQGVAFFVSMYNVRQKSVTRKSQKGERQLIRTKAAFSFTFACGDTGATYTSAWEAEAEDDGDKGINKCATAAEKYFLMKTFIMSAGDEVDADGEKPTHNAKPRQQSAPASTNGNGKAWHNSADNVELIATRIADEFNLDGWKLSEVFASFLNDKQIEDFATGRECFDHLRSNAVAWCLRAFVAPKTVTIASGKSVDTATGEILNAPAVEPGVSPFKTLDITPEIKRLECKAEHVAVGDVLREHNGRSDRDFEVLRKDAIKRDANGKHYPCKVRWVDTSKESDYILRISENGFMFQVVGGPKLALDHAGGHVEKHNAGHWTWTPAKEATS